MDPALLMENVVAGEEQIQLAQAKLRRELVSRLQTGEASRKQKGEQAEDQAARLLADQEQIELDNCYRQVEEFEQQEAARLALESGQLNYTPVEQSGVAWNDSTPGSSIGAMCFFQQGGLSTQMSYEAAVLQYLQWQSVMAVMQQPLLL